MKLPSSLRQWVSRHPLVACGAFGSVIFLGIGLIEGLVFFPTARAWLAAASWPTTTAEITSSRLYTQGRIMRPVFTYRYTWNGQAYTTSGYDLLAVSENNLERWNAVLKKYPVGSQSPVLVNPAAPRQAVLARGDVSSFLFYLTPLVFIVPGLLGAMFTTAHGLGWLDEKSRHPVGRATRALGDALLRESVLKPIFFVIIGSVILGLGVGGAINGNVPLMIAAGVMIWGVWKASRKR